EQRAAHPAGPGSVVTTAPPRQRTVVRHWSDVLLVVAGLVLLVLAAVPVYGGHVSSAEAAVFRSLNSTTVLPFVVVWPVMQLGNFLVVPVAAVVAAAFR